MRKSSQILIFVNVRKALDAGIKFHLSDNGVVLTEGDETGYLKPEFFERVEDAKTKKAVEGWEGGVCTY
jgi:2'-phosphotransferase